MKSTRANRIFSIVLSLSIVIGVTTISRDTVLADTDPTSGLTYTITDGEAAITGFTAPTGFDGILAIPVTLGGVSVTSIGEQAFAYCDSLISITVDAGNTVYKSIEGILYTKDGTGLICCPAGKSGNITIPNGVTSIGNNAFYSCTRLTRITIPSGVASIGNLAFCGCSSLTGITIPNIVTSIGDNAFAKCTRFTSITIPSGVTSIGDLVFSSCPSLMSITVDAANTAYKSIDGLLYTKDGTKLIHCPSEKSGSITIPNGVTSIEHYAFRGCDSLTSITIPSSVTRMGEGVFSDCSNLASITIPGNVTSIGYNAFSCCSNLTSITIPSNVTSIEPNTFYGCIRLTSITIPSSVVSIGESAFSSCWNLACVTFKGEVTSIEIAAFDIGAEKQIRFIVPTDKITYYQSLLNANVMNTTTAVVTDKYAVTFNANCGIAGAGSDYTQQIANDGLASAPANPPTRIGYSFAGWYEDAACSNIWDFSTDKVTNDITLYAKWIAIPASPANLKAVSAGYNSTKVTWTAVTGATGYSIYRSTSPTSGFAYIKAVTSASYTNTGLTTGTTYYYQIKAYTMVDSTKNYSAATAAVSAKPLPATPTSMKAISAGYNSNKLTWTSVAGATGYSIYRSTSPTSGFAYIKAVTTASYTNTGLTTGTTYYYQIKAYTLVGTTKIYSAFTSVVSAKPIPATPTGLTAASASATSIKISWNAVTGATGYAMYRSTLPTSGFTYIKSVTSASYTNTGLTTGTTYYYQIKAYTTVGTTKIYSTATAAVGAKP